jgi:hypothetical protein
LSSLLKISIDYFIKRYLERISIALFKVAKQETPIVLYSQLDFIQNIPETIESNNLSITSSNNETVNALCLSHAKTLK